MPPALQKKMLLQSRKKKVMHNRPPSIRPRRPGWTPLPQPVGAPDPAPVRREPADNECCQCCQPLSVRRLRTCAARGDSPLCVRCAADIRAKLRSDAAREREWEREKERRAAAREREQEKWREERRQACVAAWVDESPGRLASDYPWGGISRRGGV